jgi:signal transduction histidine kinase
MSEAAYNHILLVDDNEGTRFAFSRMLQSAGFRVTEAATGRDALRLAREMPDLVVLDIRLPDMSGYDVCRHIKSSEETAGIPVLHVSASFVRAEDQVFGLEGGADGYLTEPVDKTVLVATVRALLRARRAEAEAKRSREEAERANKAKDQFLAVLSHELRTPLTPVAMAVAALETEPNLPARVRDDLAMIRRNIALEVRLIDDLLDLSRIVNGKLRLVTQDVEVHVLLTGVVDMVREDVRSKRLRIDWDLKAASDGIKGDAARLQQVFWNVIKNAIKFTAFGGTVTIRTWNDASQRLFVEVADTGVGIEPQILPHIFRAFDQGEGEATRNFGGLGLGLSISKAIVEMHGGTILARSEGKDRGAAFTIDLPVNGVNTDVRQSDRRVEAKGAPQPGARPAAVRVLLVEDHADTLKILQRLLEMNGYAVAAATTVESATRLCEAQDFDVVVSDIGLPDATGHELMRALKERRPEMLGIAMTGYGMEQDVQNSLDAGFTTHITKPIDVETLDLVIRRMTNRAVAPRVE